MEEITGLYEKKIDTLLSKMFGDSQSELKVVTKMSLMNNILTEDMKKTLIFIGIALVVGTTGWLVYRNNRNTKIDETPIPYEDALKNLENI